DETFDQALKDAVELYERTHQMEVDGETDRTFWASLNIPADERLAQIELTMQRWRESRIGEDPYYILVNIPDFHAEVWRNGVRDMRFRIVVGNTQRVCDPRTERMRYANATPLQSAYMTHIVLNPYWNVPRRILEEELIPNLLEDGNYFEENGIEQSEDGTVRLRPGPSNPLGRVKFIFPNPHATYLHDTNRRNYFQFPVRAFSHGCMRVHEPENLMEYLLTQDGQYNERDIERSFERGREDGRSLTTPVPVHVEYYVVRIDDEGYVNFNSDIYKYDRDRLRPEEARNERCEPEARPGLRLVLSEDGRPMVQDAEGNLIDPSATNVEEVIPASDGAGPAAGDYGP
ncbi:MAG: L,D-transpeptidase family protein, partial [Myxococcales bacterium]|nr:L,D-transpeptidase family protein [Myxococcales bacterium]